MLIFFRDAQLTWGINRQLSLNSPIPRSPITNNRKTPVPQSLLFFKLASDVSGEELLKLEYMKAHRTAYGERMTEAQERQLERRLTKLCQMD